MALLILAGPIHKRLNVCWQMADLSWPHLEQLSYLALIHMAFLFQQISQIYSYSNGRDQESKKANYVGAFQAPFQFRSANISLA